MLSLFRWTAIFCCLYLVYRARTSGPAVYRKRARKFD
jgi:hypothetical protein